MIRIFLLIRENISDVIIAAAGNVNTFLCSIEVNAVHTLYRGQTCDVFTAVGIYDDHLRGCSRTDEQPVGLFVERSVTVALAAEWPCGYDLTLFRIHILNFADRRDENV